jgi:hypothetical protein
MSWCPVSGSAGRAVPAADGAAVAPAVPVGADPPARPGDAGPVCPGLAYPARGDPFAQPPASVAAASSARPPRIPGQSFTVDRMPHQAGSPVKMANRAMMMVATTDRVSGG